jgi:Ca2+-binding RTX toxin-like protein
MTNKEIIFQFEKVLLKSFSIFIIILFLLVLYGNYNPLSRLIVPEISAVNEFDNDPSDSIIRCTPLVECNGTNNKDIIIGTSASDRIFAEEGNDLVQGGLLTDEIHGDEGDDIIQGGEGSDIIFGEDGNDYLYSDAGSNFIAGGGGGQLYGGAGNDHIFGGSDNDVLIGGSGNDVFDCNEGQDRVLDFDSTKDTANSNCEFI